LLVLEGSDIKRTTIWTLRQANQSATSDTRSDDDGEA
jgi:hypothetical protein